VKAYLDTSLVLDWLLEGSTAIERLSEFEEVASSRLLWIETVRTLDRAVRSRQITDRDGIEARIAFENMARGLTRLRLTEAVLSRASEGFPTIIRTLDALHLGTALAWAEGSTRESISLWSLDAQLNLCAKALGFQVEFLP
jgi:predicted nucleic acid-binding protein